MGVERGLISWGRVLHGLCGWCRILPKPVWRIKYTGHGLDGWPSGAGGAVACHEVGKLLSGHHECGA